jgi:hypothetical protein
MADYFDDFAISDGAILSVWISASSNHSCHSEIVMFDSCSCDRFGLEIDR